MSLSQLDKATPKTMNRIINIFDNPEGLTFNPNYPPGCKPVAQMPVPVPAMDNTVRFDTHNLTLMPFGPVMTTIPATPTSFSNRWTECFVTQEAKRMILSTPGFPASIARPPARAYRIGPSPLGGTGICGSNTARHFDIQSFAMQLHAARDIEQGEELTTFYLTPFLTTQERQNICRRYSFQCVCPHCCDPEFDLRRLYLKSEFNSGVLQGRFEMWLNDLSLPDDFLIKELEDALRLVALEGLESSLVHESILHTLCAVYNAQDTDVERFHAYKAHLLKM
ncbi:hypothetical protein BDZ89DRAFT_1129491 [Hymenopellis radicata]|nr:hypothetical protein BDZ89DRAFT_1129491 [Hymenopellis radicata]